MGGNYWDILKLINNLTFPINLLADIAMMPVCIESHTLSTKERNNLKKTPAVKRNLICGVDASLLYLCGLDFGN